MIQKSEAKQWCLATLFVLICLTAFPQSARALEFTVDTGVTPMGFTEDKGGVVVVLRPNQPIREARIALLIPMSAPPRTPLTNVQYDFFLQNSENNLEIKIPSGAMQSTATGFAPSKKTKGTWLHSGSPSLWEGKQVGFPAPPFFIVRIVFTETALRDLKTKGVEVLVIQGVYFSLFHDPALQVTALIEVTVDEILLEIEKKRAEKPKEETIKGI